MTNLFKTFLAGLALLLLPALTPAFAQAETIQGAKAACEIGEQNDGYLGRVRGAEISAAVDREMRSMNQRRKAEYARLSKETGETVSIIAQLTAEKLINRAPAGHCVQDASGTWIEK